MKALIVEDKEYIRKGLMSLLETIDPSITVVGECESVVEAVTVTKACKPELIFLDINLSDGNAFDFLDQLESINFKIIFITAYEEFALKALKVGAVDYLLKPVDVDDLKKALQKIKNTDTNEQQQGINKVKQVWNGSDSTIILSLQDSFQVIELNELMYCESDKGYTTFYCTENRKFLVSKTLKEFESTLLENNFLRPHQSFMVNLKFVDKYDKSGEIVLKSGKKIPVSFRKKESFISSFLSFNRFKGN